MTTKGTDNRFRSLTVVGESGTPSTPSSGDFKLYVADDGTFYLMDDTGATVALGAGGGDITTDPAWAAKGDLIAATGNDAAAIRSVGANDTILMADSAQSTGLKWVASQTPSTQAFSDAAAEGTADTYARGDHKHGMPASPGGGGSITWLQRQTASSSAQLDFTSFISSTYDVYLFTFRDIVPATDNVNFLCRVGTGGGPTYDSGSNYSTALWRWSNAGTANTGSTGTTSFTVDSSGGIDNGANSSLSGQLHMFTPSGTSGHRSFDWESTYNDNANAPIHALGGGKYLTTTAITAVRFLMSSGNIANGIIDVYGMAHT